MMRRALVLACLSTLTVGVLSAAAAQPESSPKGDRSLCIGTTTGDPNSFDGICVWIPIH